MKAIMRSLILIVIFQLTVFSQCDKIIMDKRYPLFLVNKSNQSLAYYLAIDDGISSNTAYPDTLLPVDKITSGTVPPFETKMIEDSGLKWEIIFDTYLPQDTLSVFIFNADTLSSVSWSKIREEYLILKRYDLSLSDLEEMDWTITYP